MIVRRKSGGGTVYHDLGNINLSFITHRERHQRKDNLKFICESLMARWPHLRLSVGPRDDILLDGKYKVMFLLWELSAALLCVHDSN